MKFYQDTHSVWAKTSKRLTPSGKSSEWFVTCSTQSSGAALRISTAELLLNTQPVLAVYWLHVCLLPFHRNQCVRVTLQGGCGPASYFQCLLLTHQGMAFHSLFSVRNDTDTVIIVCRTKHHVHTGVECFLQLKWTDVNNFIVYNCVCFYLTTH